MNFPRCKYKCKCVFRDKLDGCRVLDNTSFKLTCPFAKTKEQLIKELLYCSARIDMRPSEYKEMLKDVYSNYVYRAVFNDEE